MTRHYDVIVAGAGAAGISAAYTSAKLGLKTLLIEKNIHAGGLITSGLVVPVMMLTDENINTEFYHNLIKFADKRNARITYDDGNQGWFNPEILKSVFDDMLESVDCEVLYNADITDVQTISNNSSTDFDITHNNFKLQLDVDMLSLYIETTFLVDATGDGKISQKLNCEILKDNEEKQTLSLRFIMSNVNCEKFSQWITEIDKDRNVTTSCKIGEETHFSTACTWDTNRNWALTPYFKSAIKDKVLKPSDTAYFQLFSIAGMPGSVAFNCPRLLALANTDDEAVFAQSRLVIEGRKRINRLQDFCKRYLPGFEKAYVSNIADSLGVRESVRIKGKKVFTTADILSGIKPENPALASNYPIDIHSVNKNSSTLQFTNHIWYMPIECLISEKYDNLYIVGRCLSAEFRAQAAVRTQANCFSMGEAVAKHIEKQFAKNKSN